MYTICTYNQGVMLLLGITLSATALNTRKHKHQLFIIVIIQLVKFSS